MENKKRTFTKKVAVKKQKKNFLCSLGLHNWKWYSSEALFVVTYKCKRCGELMDNYQGI